MIVAHIKPAEWADTGEQGVIQPSEVAGLVHSVELEPEDIEFLRGPAGVQGPKGDKGDTGPAGVSTQSIPAAGQISYWRRNTAPPGHLAMVGSGVLVATYPELTAACYVGDAENATAEGFYRCNAADGTGRNVAGAYLFIEDAREYFFRGLTPGGARKLGSSQTDAIKEHQHLMVYNASDNNAGYVAIKLASIAEGQGGGGGILGGGAAETRPKNRAYLVCISTGKAA